MNESNTPRTNTLEISLQKEVRDAKGRGLDFTFDMVGKVTGTLLDHSRQLERELNDANAEIKRLLSLCQTQQKQVDRLFAARNDESVKCSRWQDCANKLVDCFRGTYKSDEALALYEKLKQSLNNPD